MKISLSRQEIETIIRYIEAERSNPCLACGVNERASCTGCDCRDDYNEKHSSDFEEFENLRKQCPELIDDIEFDARKFILCYEAVAQEYAQYDNAKQCLSERCPELLKVLVHSKCAGKIFNSTNLV